ncbi:hypothetical protein STAQ_18600 [Allostella sp. ATCC 35155]|nr:hypothetical protein STAQ_18600 [Stella sp. ATCC 35155]
MLDATDLDLPDYDPDISQRLGSEDWAREFPPTSRARQRAAQIVALLDVHSRTEQSAAMEWLEEFFTRRTAAPTFRAIERGALRGLDWNTLRAMDALRAVWEDRPEWWICRVVRPGTSNGFGVVKRLANGPQALTWAAAQRICEARAHLPPEEMIDSDWLDDWYALPRDSRAAISFAEFVGQRVAEEHCRLLDEGLRLRAFAYDPTEQADRRGWHREIRHPDDGTPMSLSIVDPTERRVEGGVPE